MKISLRQTALLSLGLLFAAAVYGRTADESSPYRKFIVDVEEIEGLPSAIRAVHFKEAPLTPWFERSGVDFTFKSEAVKGKVSFRSKKMAALCDRVNNTRQFTDFVGRSSVYGIEDGRGGLEGRLFLGSICRDAGCADEDIVMITAD